MKRISLLVLIFVLGLTLTACGSSKKTTSAPANGNANFSQAFAAYSTCMAQNGVKLPPNAGFGGGNRQRGSGTPGQQGQGGAGQGGAPQNGGTRPSTTLPPGVTQDQYNKARQACQSKLPQRQGGAGGAGGTQFTAYLSCLSDHGVTVNTAGGPQALANIDRTTATFQAAQAACQALLPQRSTTTSTTPA